MIDVTADSIYYLFTFRENGVSIELQGPFVIVVCNDVEDWNGIMKSLTTTFHEIVLKKTKGQILIPIFDWIHAIIVCRKLKLQHQGQIGNVPRPNYALQH